MHQVDKLLEVATDAAVSAGELLREHFTRDMSIHVKSASDLVGGSADIVTEYDLRAEELIRARIGRVFPSARVVGEETGDSGGDEICWYVDPIDGTYNFARGVPLFCVSVGFAVGGVPVGGCVYDPVRQELFAAAGGKLTRNGAAFRPAPRPAGGALILLTDLPHGVPKDPVTSRIALELLPRTEVRQLGSTALALAWLAAGRADLAANADVFMWDVAAGRCLVDAAGGEFRAVPDPVPTDRRGTFVAWLPSGQEMGPQLADAVADIPMNGDAQ